MLVRINLLVTALVFIIFGLWGLLQPMSVIETLGLSIENAVGYTTIRAMYGGFLLGAGVLFAYCCLKHGAASFGLVALLVIVACIFSARLMGFIIDDSFSSATQKEFAGMEAVSIAVTAVQLIGNSRRKPGDRFKL